MSQEVPMLFFASGEYRYISDGRVDKKIAPDTLPPAEGFVQSTPQASIDSIDYSNHYGLLLSCLPHDICAKDIKQLNKQWRHDHRQQNKPLGYKMQNVKGLRLSPSQEMLAILSQKEVVVIKMKNLYEVGTEKRYPIPSTELTNMIWLDERALFIWSFKGRLIRLNLESGSIQIIPSINPTSAFLINNTLIVTVFNELQFYQPDTMEKFKTISWENVDFQQDQLGFFKLMHVFHIVKLNNHDARVWKDDDVYAIMGIFYIEPDDDDNQNSHFVYFARGNLLNGPMKFKSNAEVLSTLKKDMQYFRKNDQLKGFSVKTVYLKESQVIIFCFSKVEKLYQIDCCLDFDKIQEMQLESRFQFKSSYCLTGLCLFKNMLPYERQYQGQLQETNIFVSKYDGKLMSLTFKQKDLDFIVPFPPSILAINDKGELIKQYIVSMRDAVVPEGQQNKDFLNNLKLKSTIMEPDRKVQNEGRKTEQIREKPQEQVATKPKVDVEPTAEMKSPAQPQLKSQPTVESKIITIPTLTSAIKNPLNGQIQQNTAQSTAIVMPQPISAIKNPLNSEVRQQNNQNTEQSSVIQIPKTPQIITSLLPQPKKEETVQPVALIVQPVKEEQQQSKQPTKENIAQPKQSTKSASKETILQPIEPPAIKQDKKLQSPIKSVQIVPSVAPIAPVEPPSRPESLAASPVKQPVQKSAVQVKVTMSIPSMFSMSTENQQKIQKQMKEKLQTEKSKLEAEKKPPIAPSPPVFTGLFQTNKQGTMPNFFTNPMPTSSTFFTAAKPSAPSTSLKHQPEKQQIVDELQQKFKQFKPTFVELQKQLQNFKYNLDRFQRYTNEEKDKSSNFNKQIGQLPSDIQSLLQISQESEKIRQQLAVSQMCMSIKDQQQLENLKNKLRQRLKQTNEGIIRLRHLYDLTHSKIKLRKLSTSEKVKEIIDDYAQRQKDLEGQINKLVERRATQPKKKKSSKKRNQGLSFNFDVIQLSSSSSEEDIAEDGLFSSRYTCQKIGVDQEIKPTVLLKCLVDVKKQVAAPPPSLPTTQPKQPSLGFGQISQSGFPIPTPPVKKTQPKPLEQGLPPLSMFSQVSQIDKKKQPKKQVKEIEIQGKHEPGQPSTPTVSGQKAPEDKKAGQSFFKSDSGATNLFGKKGDSTNKTSLADLTSGSKAFGLNIEKPSGFNLFSKNDKKEENKTQKLQHKQPENVPKTSVEDKKLQQPQKRPQEKKEVNLFGSSGQLKSEGFASILSKADDKGPTQQTTNLFSGLSIEKSAQEKSIGKGQTKAEPKDTKAQTTKDGPKGEPQQKARTDPISISQATIPTQSIQTTQLTKPIQPTQPIIPTTQLTSTQPSFLQAAQQQAQNSSQTTQSNPNIVAQQPSDAGFAQSLRNMGQQLQQQQQPQMHRPTFGIGTGQLGNPGLNTQPQTVRSNFASFTQNNNLSSFANPPSSNQPTLAQAAQQQNPQQNQQTNMFLQNMSTQSTTNNIFLNAASQNTQSSNNFSDIFKSGSSVSQMSQNQQPNIFAQNIQGSSNPFLQNSQQNMQSHMQQGMQQNQMQMQQNQTSQNQVSFNPFAQTNQPNIFSNSQNMFTNQQSQHMQPQQPQQPQPFSYAMHESQHHQKSQVPNMFAARK